MSPARLPTPGRAGIRDAAERAVPPVLQPDPGPGAQPPASPPGLPKYLRLERKELLIWPDQVTSLSVLARVLNRNRRSAGERITINTLIRVAAALLLSRSQDLAGTTEEEFRRSLGLLDSPVPLPGAGRAGIRNAVLHDAAPAAVPPGRSDPGQDTRSSGRPTRITVDLLPDLHGFLRGSARARNFAAADVIRELIRQMRAAPDLWDRVMAELERRREALAEAVQAAREPEAREARTKLPRHRFDFQFDMRPHLVHMFALASVEMYPGSVGTTQAAVNQARYPSRPGRAALVAADLADLQGPSTGTVELPLRLFWSAPDRRFDLSDPDMLRSMYEKVLREAIRTEDLTTFLNGSTLLAVWRDLFLPRDVRRAWEDRHPVLRRAAAA